MDITPIPNTGGDPILPESVDGFGVMFRYQDNGRYYRLGFNSNQGSVRLVKKRRELFNDSSDTDAFSTLASNYRGHLPGQTINVVVEVEGNLIQVFVDGEALFSAVDTAAPVLLSGGVALFSRDAVEFDNVRLRVNDNSDGLGNDNETDIVIATPISHDVIPGGSQDVDVVAIARNIDTAGGDTVSISAGGSDCGVPLESPAGVFTVTCASVPVGTTSFTASMTTSGANNGDADTNAMVTIGAATGSNATSGNKYDAVGDSITMGLFDNYRGDGLPPPADRLAISQRGWPATLTDLLASSTGQPNLVGNEGVPGSDLQGANPATVEGLIEVNTIIERNPGSNGALVMYGTNDSSGGTPANCAGGAKGSYAANYVTLIDRLQDAGRDQIYVALIPPVWGDSNSNSPYLSDPDQGTRNQCIEALNSAIETSVLVDPQVTEPGDTAPVLGPDFYTCLVGAGQNRFNLFEDLLHFNGLGTAYMASLWEDAILNGSVSGVCPDTGFYLLDDLAYDWNGDGIDLNSADVNIFQQNRLEVGDFYYVVSTAAFPFQHRTQFIHTLTSIPTELDTLDARWIMTPNEVVSGFGTDTDSDVVTFDVGGDGATVYVAHDPGGAPPTVSCDDSPGCVFAASSLTGSLSTTDPNVGSFDVVQISASVTGMIRLGGNHSGDTLANASYIVIVVPD